MTRPRHPKYVHVILHKPTGTRRAYLRKPGHKAVRLPDPLKGWTVFMLAYDRALAELDAAPRPAVRAVNPATFDGLITLFLSSHNYASCAPETKRTIRGRMEAFRKEVGHLLYADLKPKHVRQRLDKFAARPSAANNQLRLVRQLMRFAQERGLRNDDPTIGIKKLKTPAGGFQAWSEEQIKQFEAHHPVGSRARLALALGVHTGQRRGDVVKMGPQHLGPHGLTIRQNKTGNVLTVPVHPDLAAMLAAIPPGAPAFLLTAHGRPFTAESFGNRWRAWVAEAGLPPEIAFHGLRKAAAVRLAEAGATAIQIAAWTGHKSLSEVQRYVDSANQVRLAQQGAAKVEAHKSKSRRTGP